MGFESSGDAIGDAHSIVDEATSILDELPEGSHRGALGPERFELVAVLEQDVEGQPGVGGVVLGSAGVPSITIASKGLRIDRKHDDEVVLEKGGHDRSALELNANSDGLALEALAELQEPRVEFGRRMLDDPLLDLLGASRNQADVVLSVAQSMPMNAENSVSFAANSFTKTSSSDKLSRTCRLGSGEGNMEAG
jgi:hypothetical protein